MQAILWAAVCFAHVCVAKQVTVLPFEQCASVIGQRLAYEYALKHNYYFKDWTCEVERSA